MQSIQGLSEHRLKLRGNRSKSTAALVTKPQFLGYRLLRNRLLMLSPESLRRFKDTIHALTKPKRRRRLESIYARVAE